MKNEIMTIEQIVEIDDAVFNVLAKDAGNVFLVFKNNNLEQTGKALSLFHAKIGFLKNGIFEQLESGNIYSANVLYRAMIEHYLKAEYILFESVRQGNDSVGSDYYEFADASEKIQLGSAYKRAAEILYPTKSFSNFYESIQEVFPKLKKYSKKEISSQTSKFNYRSIIEYLYDLFYIQKAEQGTEENFLINLIPEYSDLSSYVHGGPAADHALMALGIGDQAKRTDEITNIFYKTIMLSTHFCSLLYMFAVKYEEKYKKPFIELHHELKKLMKLKS
jgi:hypothetical protein